MKKFLVLYQSDAALTGSSVSEMFASVTPEQMKAGMAAWQAWHEKAGAALADFGAPLDHSTTVAGDVATPGKTIVTGYSILQAASMDEVVLLMKGHPHLRMPGSSAQILECVAMPGM
jgi:hypothetical protein